MRCLSGLVDERGERAHFKGVRNHLQDAITSRESRGFLLDAEVAAVAAGRKLINFYTVEVKPIPGAVRRVLTRWTGGGLVRRIAVVSGCVQMAADVAN